MITVVARDYGVPLGAAQWTLTIALLSGAVATPILGRLGSGPHRRTTVLVTLGVVVTGSILTVIPAPFALLLVGRAGQGVGLGLTALMMATARDHLPPRRAGATIALLSVTSTVGIGVGYPLAGLLTDLAGPRAAYSLGLMISAIALLAAAIALPSAPPRPATRVDVTSALLLSTGLLAVLFVIGQTELWIRQTGLAALILIAGLVILVFWGLREARAVQPLVDIRLLRHPSVATANLVMLAGGVAMYLLLSLISRYVQTPTSTGYGFGLSTLQSGLVLVPFSLLGFVAGRLLPPLQRRVPARTLLVASAAVVLLAHVLFALARQPLLAPVLAMSVLGLGVGAFSASMPAVILAATPPAETASAMAVNQVVRSVGFAIGSALGGLILAAHTGTGPFPQNDGYTVAAWIGAAIAALTVCVAAVAPLAGRSHP